MLDATETGDLLPLTGCEYVTGFESRSETGEPSAPEEPQPLNMQAVSVCFAMDHVDGDHTIDKPAGYDFWRSYQPTFWGAPLFSWVAPNPRTRQPERRIFDPNPDDDPQAVRPTSARRAATSTCGRSAGSPPGRTSSTGRYDSDITLVNWPMIDYFEGPVIEVADAGHHLERARDLSRVLSLLDADRGAASRWRHRLPRSAASR